MARASFIAESFDSRTLADMEVALERACKILPAGGEEHSARRHIASKILKCARRGDVTLGALTAAGRVAAGELCAADVTDTKRAGGSLSPDWSNRTVL
jgi:hypothetical protein